MVMRGHLNHATHERILGWAWEEGEADAPVSLAVFINGRFAGRCLANRYRRDLEQAGIGAGRHSFEFRPVPALSPLERHEIVVRREGDGAPLRGVPLILEPVGAFDGPAQAAIERLLSAAGDEDDLIARLAFVERQADRLRQLHADRTDGPDRARFRRALRRHETGVPEAALDGAPDRPRALVIDDVMPDPRRDAGSNAVLSHMQALQRLGYAVTFAPANLRGDPAGLATHGIGTALRPWVRTIEELLGRQRAQFALVYLHRATNAGRYLALARESQPKARIVYAVADLHHLRLARQAEVESRPELRSHAENLRIAELGAAWLSDAVITHSPVEAELLARHVGRAQVHVVPWAVAPRPTAVPFAERHGLAFVGGFGHRPNVDAALWLVDDVMPALAAEGGGLTCRLVGSNMPDSLRHLARADIDPVGFVPDLASVFDTVRLTVAPLAYGAGIKGKVLDSLAAGIPCVCTPAAAEGMDLPEPLLRLVAATPADIARSIRALHEDAALNAECAEAGLAYIAARASEAQVDARLRAALGRA